VLDLGEIQDVRLLHLLVRLRTRWRAAQGDWQGALESLRTHFAMVRHCGEYHCAMGSLVTTAVEAAADRDLLESIQGPKCPTLLWPIAALPDELYDMRPIVEFEIRCFLNHVPQIRDADKLELSPEEWSKVLEEHVAAAVNYPRASPFDEKYHRIFAA